MAAERTRSVHAPIGQTMTMAYKLAHELQKRSGQPYRRCLDAVSRQGVEAIGMWLERTSGKLPRPDHAR